MAEMLLYMLDAKLVDSEEFDDAFLDSSSDGQAQLILRG